MIGSSGNQRFDIPDSWAWMTVADLAAHEAGAITDGPFGSNLKTEHYTSSGPRVVRLQNIGDATFVDEHAHVSEAHFERLRRHEVRSDDVLVAMLGEALPRACLAPASLGSAIVKADCARLRTNPHLVTARYAMLALNSQPVRTAALELVHGVGRPRLGLGLLRELKVPVAPLSEQRRIVAAIESYFSRLDDAVATLERVQRNLERYRASVLKAAVECRLVPTEAELARKEGRTYEPASELLKRILSERRRRWEEAELARFKAKGQPLKDDRWKAKYDEPAPPNTESLPKLPEAWCWASLSQVSSRITSGSRDWTPFYGRGKGVFLMAQNVRAGRLDLSFIQPVDPPRDDTSCARSQVEINDVLVTIVGANTGDVCRVPVELPNHFVCQSVALIRPVLPAMGRFVDAVLNSPLGRSTFAAFMYGQGRPHLSFEQLASAPIPVPPLAEQARITAAIDEDLSRASAATSLVEASARHGGRLRQSILAWAFAGRIVAQDPTDETASALLDRIHTERDGTSLSRASGSRRQRAPSR